MANYNLKDYLNRLKNANIGYETGTGDFKNDYYVTAGQNTPHLHLDEGGNFVGLKKKQSAMTTLVINGSFKIDTIRAEIDDLKKSSTTTNDENVVDALIELATQYKDNS